MLCASHLLTNRFRNINCQVLRSTVLMQPNGTYIAAWQDVRYRMSSLKLFVFIVTPSKQINKCGKVWRNASITGLSPHFPSSVKDPLICCAVYSSNRTRVFVRPSVQWSVFQ